MTQNMETKLKDGKYYLIFIQPNIDVVWTVARCEYDDSEPPELCLNTFWGDWYKDDCMEIIPLSLATQAYELQAQVKQLRDTIKHHMDCTCFFIANPPCAKCEALNECQCDEGIANSDLICQKCGKKVM